MASALASAASPARIVNRIPGGGSAHVSSKASRLTCVAPPLPTGGRLAGTRGFRHGYPFP
jgi:hypothetical protein